MRLEDELKELILKRYKSLREFCLAIDIPYSTIDSILHRGILNAGVGKVITICHNLEISVDKLAEGQIMPAETKYPATITLKEQKILQSYRTLDDDGRELVDSLIQKLYEQRSSKLSDTSDEAMIG